MISLGCAKNLVDSEVIAGILERAGFQVTERAEGSDVAVVNTCAFIRDAQEEAIETIFALARLKEQGKLKKLIVAGCLPQRYCSQIKKLLPEADGFLGPGRIGDIAGTVRAVLKSELRVNIGEKHFLNTAATPRRLLTPVHYAYVKIADGCDNRCAYCVIPGIRGRYESREMNSIVKEVKKLTAKGVREINLISQDTTYYGADIYGKPALAELLRRLAGLKKAGWIRILYTHPRHFTDELIGVIAGEKKICKYIDMPLQHISDKILKGMGRKIDSRRIKELIRRLRGSIPGVILRTSLIVGFPGETERDFNMLCDFVQETEFERLGVFKYSREEGTRAAKMRPQVPEKTKERRFCKIMLLQQKIAAKKQAALIGTRMPVLIDSIERSGAVGRSRFDAPDVDGVIYVKSRGLRPGQIIDVRITDSLVYDLIGRKV